jgi:hypothetical protein
MTEIEQLLQSEQKIQFKAPCIIHVGKCKYKIKQVSNAVATKIQELNTEALFLERKAQSALTLKEANKINRKLRTLHSKTAAYYLLNNWALVPFIFAYMWHKIDRRSSEHSYMINDAGANNKGYAFFLLNWQITKSQLALSTNLIGESVKQSAERKESATNMLDEDALPKKEEDSKLQARSKRPQITKK